MSGNDGLKSVLSEAARQGGAAAPGGDAPADQLSLLAELQGEFARNVDLEVIEGEGGGAAPRGVGRPKGSRSKTTQEWQAFIRSNYGDPMVALAQIAFGNTALLAKKHGVKIEEMSQRQLRAAEALLPYFHQKMPQAIELDNRVTIFQLVKATYDAAQSAVRGDVTEVIENQQVSEDDSGQV